MTPWVSLETHGARAVRVIRHDVPFDTLEDVVTAYGGAAEALERMDRARMGGVVDLRSAPSRNDPAFEDTSIQRYLPALTQALEALKSDPEIRALHDDCVARHRARRDALLTQDSYRDMRTALARASTLPPAEEALIAELGLAP